MTSVGNRILKSKGVPEPDPKLLEILRQAPVANIDDAMGRLAAMDPSLRPLNSYPLTGRAFTVRVPDGDNLFIHAAMDLLAPSDVLVVQGGQGTDRALLGELMLQYLVTKEIAGVVIDGLVRDLDYISMDCPFPVYARGTSPNGPYKNGPGEINTPISCGGIVVRPGDVIRGDRDGIVVVRQEDLAEVGAAVTHIQEKEAGVINGIQESGTFSRPWVSQQLEALGTVIRDA